MLLLGVVAVGCWAALRPPPVRSSQAGADEIAVSRVFEVLRRVVGDDPHPVGSVAHREVRERIVEELSRHGFAVEIQEAFVSAAPGVFARVANIVARLDGVEDRQGLLLAAHYDSVPAGPGAADDGHAVALLLELARVLAQGERPRGPVVFLFSDGEELGLAGARAFVESHRWFRDVSHVINLEARGTTGPSLMFETSDGNAELIVRLARSVARPFASSLFASVYRRMPNDTDFTVYRDHGLQGYNLAFIGGVARYHSERDDLLHLDPRSVQHQGDNLLALTRALVFAPAPAAHRGDACYFDLWGRAIVRWPTGWTLPIALVFMAVLVSAAWKRTRVVVGEVTWRTWGTALGACALAPTLAGVGAQMVDRSIGEWFGIDEPFVATRWPIVTFHWLMGLSIAWLTWSRIGAGVPRDVRWLTQGLIMAVLAVATAAWDPRVSPPFLAVAGCSALLAVPWLRSTLPSANAQIALFGLAAVAAGLVWLPIAYLLVDALGVGLWGVLPPVVLILPSLVPILPLSGRAANVAIIGLACAALGAIVAASVLPLRTADQPSLLNLLYVADADAHTAHWVAGRSREQLPSALARALEPQAPFPDVPGWSLGLAGSASPAPYLSTPALAGPELRVLQAEQAPARHTFRLRLRSPAGAPVISLLVPPKLWVEEVELLEPRLDRAEDPPIDAATRPRTPPHDVGWQALQFHGLDARGVELRLTLVPLDASSMLRLVALETHYRLPPEGRALVASRGTEYVAKHRGDRALVWRTIRPTP
ncbi:MAG: M20/M25/M40 family metallo-hydrolase [Planctomycetota bacterium]